MKSLRRGILSVLAMVFAVSLLTPCVRADIGMYGGPDGIDYVQPPKHFKTLGMMLAEAEMAKIMGPPPVAVSGTRDLLVILVELSDATPDGAHTIGFFEDRFFDNSPPSVRDYYDEVSYGNFTYDEADVLGWYALAYTQAQWDASPKPVVAAAIQAADADFNYAPYDTDSSGTVTNDELTIFIIVSGTVGGAFHWWTNSSVSTGDGVNVEGEFCATHEWRHIGSYCHELGHDLGLPDLYDVNGGSEGIGNYGLMGGGSWTFAQMTAWSKIQLGWLTPTIVTSPDCIEVNDSETNAEAYVLIDYGYSSDEYFLIENKHPWSSDYEMIGAPVAPSGTFPDSGIMILHIDEAQVQDWITSGTNNVNNDEAHKGVDVETAEHPTSHVANADDLDAEVNRGDGDDLWDDGEYDFDDTSTPCNANWYVSTASGMRVGAFSASGPMMTVCLLGLAPIADADGPYTGDEGSPITLDGSGSYDPDGGSIVLYEWDLDNDGQYDDATGVTPTETWPDDYSGVIGLRVEDDEGETAEDSTTVTILNVAPTVYFDPIVPADEGSMFTGSGWFEDPGDDTWTATVDYGDGSEAQSLALNADKTFDLAHTYCDNDDYTITVTVEDDDGGVGVGNAIAPINNVIPVVDAGADQTIMAGDYTTFTGTYSDAGWCDTHTAMWDFGDAGATAAGVVTANPVLPPAPVTGTVAVIDPPGGHSYFSAGDHTVTLTVTDDDLGAGSDTLTVEVEYIPATIFFDMDTINKKGGEKWFTVYIELPVRGDVKEINLASLLLNGVVPAETDPKYGFVKSEDSYIMDTDEDEELERMVKFPRKDVAAILAVGDEVEVAVTGCVQYTNDHGDTGCADFKGTETIRVIEKGKPVAAPALAASSTFGAPECYPNPANPEVWIPYKLGRGVDVNITIYDANGQLIRMLKLGHQEAGAYISKNKAAYWDGRNEAGEQVASGIYFYTIQVGDFTATRKMVIAK